MTMTITKRGYWCLRVVYTSCQGLESDGRNFLAAIVQYVTVDTSKTHSNSTIVRIRYKIETGTVKCFEFIINC
jgi:hypothetical protein